MRALVVVLVACGGASPVKPEPAHAAPVSAPAPVDDACAGLAKVQPQLDANLALQHRWGEPPDLPATIKLPVASDALESVTARQVTIAMTQDGITMLGATVSAEGVRRKLGELGAHEVVLAIDGSTSWRDVASFTHSLPEGLIVDLAYAVPDPHIGDAAAVAQLRAGGSAGFRKLAAELTQRCPAIADLSAPSGDIVAKFTHGFGPALRTCHCAVAPDELLTVYSALFVSPYIGIRRVTLARTGAKIGGGRAASFADVAPHFIGLASSAVVRFDVDH